MNQELYQEIQHLLNIGNKIEAVKFAKESLNLGLKEAKDLVDAMESGKLINTFASQSPANNDFLSELITLIQNNQKLVALKLAKETLNIGLKEAKDLVDELSEAQNFPISNSNASFSSTNPIEDEAFHQKILALLFKNQKLEAIKLTAQTYGWGLKEAKDLVDKLERMM